MRVVEIKNALVGGFKHHHYSQVGEDVILGSMLRAPHGFYVDVGANHPWRYSNTALLYQRGWRGINIDPNTEAMQRFAQARRRDTNLVCGVGASEGLLTYYRFSDPAVNTFSPTVAEKLRTKKWLVELPAQTVPVFPLAKILAEHVPPSTQIDFMNVDVEGHDLEVLASNDWARFAPTVIAVEDHAFDPEQPHSSAICTYLHDHGYHLAAHVGPTIICIRKETK